MIYTNGDYLILPFSCSTSTYSLHQFFMFVLSLDNFVTFIFSLKIKAFILQCKKAKRFTFNSYKINLSFQESNILPVLFRFNNLFHHKQNIFILQNIIIMVNLFIQIYPLRWIVKLWHLIAVKISKHNLFRKNQILKPTHNQSHWSIFLRYLFLI